MNFGTLLLLLVIWSASGTVGMFLLRRKGYDFDSANYSEPGRKGDPTDFINFTASQGANIESHFGGLLLPMVGGVILLVAGLVLPRKQQHYE